METPIRVDQVSATCSWALEITHVHIYIYTSYIRIHKYMDIYIQMYHVYMYIYMQLYIYIHTKIHIRDPGTAGPPSPLRFPPIGWSFLFGTIVDFGRTTPPVVLWPVV